MYVANRAIMYGMKVTFQYRQLKLYVVISRRYLQKRQINMCTLKY